MALPRVLLLEDDPAVVRFFGMALDDMDMALLPCDSVAAAVEALRQDQAHLIITDLMLPGEQGIGLLQRMQAEPALRGDAQVVVCSAGITGPVQTELAAYGVWRQLHKPVSVEALRVCVEEGLALSTRAARVSAKADQDFRQEAVDSVGQDADPETQSIARHFGGNEALFHAYRATCLLQFNNDIVAGDQAFMLRNLPALRRMGHNLASVLASLGHPVAGATARRLELHAEHGQADEAASAWTLLRGDLAALAALAAQAARPGIA
ncbi:MAG: hypothetical protein JWQ88_699 [Rhodoferax sp.]|nr:hypothetical protein [Rhodoferax sp.]